MAFRTVLIESEVGIKLKLNNLIITKNGEDLWIPIDDISVIVMDNLSTNISVRALSYLAEKGVAVVICNNEHLPVGYYGAYDNHSRASKVLGYQINYGTELYNVLWREIIENKIHNQRIVLERTGKSSEEILQKMNGLKISVQDGDPTNREAHAAKIYFNSLMGVTFSRGNEELLLNSGLDYGYAILRSYIARLCVAYGLNTQIGIHHKNEYNRFNLVDDLIEPIRPFVDLYAFYLLKNEKYFKIEHRRKLVNFVNHKVIYNNKKMYICNMLEEYIEQVAGVIMGKRVCILFPDAKNYIMDENDGL